VDSSSARVQSQSSLRFFWELCFSVSFYCFWHSRYISSVVLTTSAVLCGFALLFIEKFRLSLPTVVFLEYYATFFLKCA
jgi:hypothetical protein